METELRAESPFQKLNFGNTSEKKRKDRCQTFFFLFLLHYGKRLIAVFQEFYASIKIFILAGRLVTELSFYGV